MTAPPTPPRQHPGPPRRLAAGVILLSLGGVVVAERDLARRPPAHIRGPRWLWRVGCSDAMIAVAYLRWGRRRG